MSISSLIAAITPLYNKFKSKDQNGIEQLKIAWEIGGKLHDYIKSNKIAPHTLFRKIYGKGEGSSDIAKKSYIPREFQGRCYRIFNLYDSKIKIEKDFPTLASFTLFRESMPFLDNDKYKFSGQRKKELLALLNSDKKPSIIMSEVRKLLKENIGMKNSRNQRLSELHDEKRCFIDFYNHIFAMTKLNQNELKRKLADNKIDDALIINLIENTNAMSRDGLMYTQFEYTFTQNNSIWGDYYHVVTNFAKEKDAKKIRRFRRIIPSIRIINLASMLSSLLQVKNKKS